MMIKLSGFIIISQILRLQPTSVTVDDVLAYFEGVESRRERMARFTSSFSDQDKFITCYLVDEEKDLVQYAEYVFKGEIDSQGITFLILVIVASILLLRTMLQSYTKELLQ